MMFKGTPLVGLLFYISSNPCFAKVVKSDKNDVSTLNETVPVLNIEDLNKTQYLNQNFRHGNYNYGYDVKPEGPNGQFHHENKATDGVVFGCYGYVDPNDKPQITYYVSDSWGYRPITFGHSIKLFYPSDHAEGSPEMKGTQREWTQLEFPKQCANYVEEGSTLSVGSGISPLTDFLPPQGVFKAPPGVPISLVTTYSNAEKTVPSSRDIGYPGNLGKPGAPGTLTEGGYGGEGGTGGLVSGSSAANGGPGGHGGDGGTSSGSSKASGGNGGSGGHAGSASGSSFANGGVGGHGGDGGEASGSSDATGGHGGGGGKGGSASGSSNASGAAAGSGGRGGVASGSSSALGGTGGHGGEGGNASGSSASKGGIGGTGGRGGTASGSSAANGGLAGSGGGGGNASGSSSASAGDGGSSGNGGIASGSSTANGGSGGTGGAGAGGSGVVESGSSEKDGYSYKPPKGFDGSKSYAQRIPSSVPPSSSSSQGPIPLPASGGLLSEEQFLEQNGNQPNRPSSTSFGHHISSTRPETTPTNPPSSGYNYHPPDKTFQHTGSYPSSQAPETQRPISGGYNPQTGNRQSGYQPLPQTGNTVPISHPPYNRDPSIQTQQPTIGQNPNQHPSQQLLITEPGSSSSRPRQPGSASGGYIPISTSQPLGLNPPAFQSPNYGDRFQTTNVYPSKGSKYPQPNLIQVPAGVYVPPNESLESGETDQNTLGNDSGERPSMISGCEQGQGYSCNTQQQPQEIDYAQIPGAITSNVPVIFYPDCRSNAYTRPAIVPFCPSLQQSPPTSSCSHQQPLTMKFPTGGNPYNNVPSSRGAYPSTFGNIFSTSQLRPSKRVVRRSRYNNHQIRFV